jgi:hypothetical protein
MPELNPHSPSKEDLSSLAFETDTSGLIPQKKELHKKFIQTLQQVLPHLGKDEGKIVSALIILALKLEGVIGKEISEKDSKLIKLLKEMIFNDQEKKESVMKMAERLNRTKLNTPPSK